MGFWICGASIYVDRVFKKSDIFIENGRIFDICPVGVPGFDDVVYNMPNCFLLPGLIDVHVHLREPGYFYKETIQTGTMAAARGGFTAICSMPNLNPVPDCIENLRVQRDIIKNDACIKVKPYGSISVGQRGEELSDMEALAPYVAAFSDDGVWASSAEITEKAMIKAKSLGKIIASHCEVTELVRGGYVHEGEYARINGHLPNASASEWKAVERDLELVRRTGCHYHVCHISTRESVELIRQAKSEGLAVTCETAPHYLALCDMELKDEGRFRMNPPVRSIEDQKALIEGILDGTIDMIATDHAPHSAEEKSGGLRNSLNGIVGLETSFPVMYTRLVRTGIITLPRLVELMHTRPREIFNIGSSLEVGKPADFAVFNLENEFEINPAKFLSKGKATPFAGDKVYGKCLMTVSDGNVVWKENIVEASDI